MKRRIEDQSSPAVSRWRDRLAWVIPALTSTACAGFFVAFAMRAPWLTQSADGRSLSRATVIAVILLAAMALAIMSYTFIAARTDRILPGSK